MSEFINLLTQFKAGHTYTHYGIPSSDMKRYLGGELPAIGTEEEKFKLLPEDYKDKILTQVRSEQINKHGFSLKISGYKDVFQKLETLDNIFDEYEKTEGEKSFFAFVDKINEAWKTNDRSLSVFLGLSEQYLSELRRENYNIKTETLIKFYRGNSENSNIPSSHLLSHSRFLEFCSIASGNRKVLERYEKYSDTKGIKAMELFFDEKLDKQSDPYKRPLISKAYYQELIRYYGLPNSLMQLLTNSKKSVDFSYYASGRIWFGEFHSVHSLETPFVVAQALYRHDVDNNKETQQSLDTAMRFMGISKFRGEKKLIDDFISGNISVKDFFYITRVQNKLDVAQMANILGIEYSTLSSIEKGVIPKRSENLASRLIDVFFKTHGKNHFSEISYAITGAYEKYDFKIIQKLRNTAGLITRNEATITENGDVISNEREVISLKDCISQLQKNISRSDKFLISEKYKVKKLKDSFGIFSFNNIKNKGILPDFMLENNSEKLDILAKNLGIPACDRNFFIESAIILSSEAKLRSQNNSSKLKNSNGLTTLGID